MYSGGGGGAAETVASTKKGRSRWVQPQDCSGYLLALHLLNASAYSTLSMNPDTAYTWVVRAKKDWELRLGGGLSILS